jgi:N-acyl-L-homoserine lactone synthetase
MTWTHDHSSAARPLPDSAWPSGLGRTDPALLAREDGYRVELLRNEADRAQAFRIRHKLFAEILHWVPERPDGLEIDRYDAFTEMVALLDPAGTVLGCVRVHDSSVPYMIEREFATVLGSGPIPFKGRDTGELTRFGVLAEARTLVVRSERGRFDAITLLLKGLYRWSRRHQVRTLYAVTDAMVLRVLRSRGLPFEAIAPPKIMPDGVKALAVRLEWPALFAQNQERNPGLLAWFDAEDPADAELLPSPQLQQAQ